MTPARVAILCEAGIRFVYPQVPDLAELLARDGHEVAVLGPADAEVAAWNAGRGFEYRAVAQRGSRGWTYNLAFVLSAIWHCRRADKVIACTAVSLVTALLAHVLFAKPYAYYALECQLPGERGAGFYCWFQHLLRIGRPVVAATGEHRARALRRFLHLDRRPAVVENAALLPDVNAHPVKDDVRADVRKRLARDPGFLVVLNGGLGRINGIDVVLETAACLPPGVTIAMLGPVEPAAGPAIVAALHRCPNLVYIGRIDGRRAQLIDYLSTADLGLVLKRHGRGQCLNDRLYTPNKLYDFVAARVPVICSCQRSMEHVARDGLGLVLPRLTPQALLECLNAVRQLPPERRAGWRSHIEDRYKSRYHFEHDAGVFRTFCGTG
jgi:hypothetical protein